MAITTGTIVFYHEGLENLGKNVDLESDTIRLGLSTSGYSPSASTHDTLSDITNEVSGNGYARQTLTGVTWANSGGTTTFNANDVVITASGGSIVARYWWLFDDTVTSPVDPLFCYGLLDSSNQDVTTTAGNTLTISWNGSGIFTVS